MARARLLVVRLLLPALVLVGAGWLLLPSTAAPTASFITAPVERRDLEQSVLADGTLQAQKLVSVGAQVSGQIKVSVAAWRTMRDRRCTWRWGTR